jgi:hypothetical protein
MDLEENPFAHSEEQELDENGCQIMAVETHMEDKPMQDEAPKDLKLKDIKYTDTSKILK